MRQEYFLYKNNSADDVTEDDPVLNITLAFASLLTCRADELIGSSEKMLQLLGRNPFPLAGLGLAYAQAGRIDDAKKVLTELHQISNKAYVPPFCFALVSLGLQQVDKALDWFEKEVAAHDPNFVCIYALPLFDPLRSHPRSHALLRKMNLEP